MVEQAEGNDYSTPTVHLKGDLKNSIFLIGKSHKSMPN